MLLLVSTDWTGPSAYQQVLGFGKEQVADLADTMIAWHPIQVWRTPGGSPHSHPASCMLRTFHAAGQICRRGGEVVKTQADEHEQDTATSLCAYTAGVMFVHASIMRHWLCWGGGVAAAAPSHNVHQRTHDMRRPATGAQGQLLDCAHYTHGSQVRAALFTCASSPVVAAVGCALLDGRYRHQERLLGPAPVVLLPPLCLHLDGRSCSA